MLKNLGKLATLTSALALGGCSELVKDSPTHDINKARIETAREINRSMTNRCVIETDIIPMPRMDHARHAAYDNNRTKIADIFVEPDIGNGPRIIAWDDSNRNGGVDPWEYFEVFTDTAAAAKALSSWEYSDRMKNHKEGKLPAEQIAAQK